jgi:hypothetical protein
MNLIQVGDGWQVRDGRGHLEISCATHDEAAAWIAGYRTADERGRERSKAVAEIATTMANSGLMK